MTSKNQPTPDQPTGAKPEAAASLGASLTPQALTSIRERAEARLLSPAPWHIPPWDGQRQADDIRDANGGYVCTASGADAAFIAHARQDIPALIAEVERLREAVVAAERFHEAFFMWASERSGTLMDTQSERGKDASEAYRTCENALVAVGASDLSNRARSCDGPAFYTRFVGTPLKAARRAAALAKADAILSLPSVGGGELEDQGSVASLPVVTADEPATPSTDQLLAGLEARADQLDRNSQDPGASDYEATLYEGQADGIRSAVKAIRAALSTPDAGRGSEEDQGRHLAKDALPRGETHPAALQEPSADESQKRGAYCLREPAKRCPLRCHRRPAGYCDRKVTDELRPYYKSTR